MPLDDALRPHPLPPTLWQDSGPKKSPKDLFSTQNVVILKENPWNVSLKES